MLSLYLVFELWQARDHQPQPYPLSVSASREAFVAIFPIYLHHLFDPSRKKDNRVMSRFGNCCRNKANLLYFDYAARA